MYWNYFENYGFSCHYDLYVNEKMYRIRVGRSIKNPNNEKKLHYVVVIGIWCKPNTPNRLVNANGLSYHKTKVISYHSNHLQGTRSKHMPYEQIEKIVAKMIDLEILQ